MLKQQAEHMAQTLKASQQRFEQDSIRLEQQELEKEQRRAMIQKLRDELEAIKTSTLAEEKQLEADTKASEVRVATVPGLTLPRLAAPPPC